MKWVKQNVDHKMSTCKGFSLFNFMSINHYCHSFDSKILEHYHHLQIRKGVFWKWTVNVQIHILEMDNMSLIYILFKIILDFSCFCFCFFIFSSYFLLFSSCFSSYFLPTFFCLSFLLFFQTFKLSLYSISSAFILFNSLLLISLRYFWGHILTTDFLSVHSSRVSMRFDVIVLPSFLMT